MEGGSVGHKFERDPPKDRPCRVWFNLVQGFQRRRFKCESLQRTTDAKWAKENGQEKQELEQGNQTFTIFQ